MADFPAHPDLVTPDWLNTLLAGTQALASGGISGCELAANWDGTSR